jgi:hypothetical protein
MNRLARLGATSGAVILALSLAAPAEAARYVHHDAAGDVVVERCSFTFTEPEPDPATSPTADPSAQPGTSPETAPVLADEEDPEDEDCTDAREPSFKEGDITRVAIRHTNRRVIIRTNYRELTRGEGFRVLVGQIRTNEHVARDVTLFYDRDFAPKGEVVLSRHNGDEVHCSLGKTLDFTANVIEVRIPRGCLSRPRWVRVGVGHVSMKFTGSETGGQTVVAIDDALRTGTTLDSDLTWTPRIRKG